MHCIVPYRLDALFSAVARRLLLGRQADSTWHIETGSGAFPRKYRDGFLSCFEFELGWILLGDSRMDWIAQPAVHLAVWCCFFIHVASARGNEFAAVQGWDGAPDFRRLSIA